MFNITIKSIPHKEQRYETVGDWWWNKDGSLDIRVSDMGDWRYEVLVCFHELCEVLICKFKGIKQEDVDAFDIKYEENRPEGNEDEPGDDPKAPYHLEHSAATACERVLAIGLGVNWKEYNDAVMSL